MVATFSGKADTNKTVFYYDYYSVKKNTGGMSYIADEGTEGNATDYMTGFFYKIDTNPSDISLDGSWTRVDSGDHTGATKNSAKWHVNNLIWKSTCIILLRHT